MRNAKESPAFTPQSRENGKEDRQEPPEKLSGFFYQGDGTIKVNVVCVGKMKEAYYLRAQAEYVKMLGRFCSVRVTEVPDEPLSRVRSEKDEEAVRTAEGRRVLERCEGYVAVCDLHGKRFTSEAFSRKLSGIMTGGAGTITFVVGGSTGLSGEVKARADLSVSFSDMTMPHRLFRIVLLEQVYRAFKIMRGETYHK